MEKQRNRDRKVAAGGTELADWGWVGVGAFGDGETQSEALPPTLTTTSSNH